MPDHAFDQLLCSGEYGPICQLIVRQRHGCRNGKQCPPDALLQLELLAQEVGALVPHLLQLLLQAQVVLYLLARVVVTQPAGVHQVLQTQNAMQRETSSVTHC